jgi:hypothetical protein
MSTVNLHQLEADLRPLVREAMKKKKKGNDDDPKTTLHQSE